MDCPICYNKITKNESFTILNCMCQTFYHSKCIDIWLKNNNSCPTCRKIWIKPNLRRNIDNNPIRRRRNAMTPDIARMLTSRLFLESIGINSSNFSNTNLPSPTIDFEIDL